MKSCFGNMLSGKKFPQDSRALRFMTEELLCVHIEGCKSHDEMQIALEIISSRLGIKNLTKPVLLMMAFKHAERETDWPSIFWQ